MLLRLILTFLIECFIQLRECTYAVGDRGAAVLVSIHNFYSFSICINVYRKSGARALGDGYDMYMYIYVYVQGHL